MVSREVRPVRGAPLAAELLATKLLVPALAPETTARPRLVERLREATRRRLTVVVAPAGFGKTTAVASWIAETKLPVAWLALDDGDNDLGRFLAHVVGALSSRWPQACAATATRIARGSRGADEILGALLNDLAGVGAPMTLVLDEFEVVQSQGVLDAVAFILEHQPPNLHVVLCTRSEPRLPLPRLRARGQLAEVTVDDLRFTLDEAASYLEQAMSLQLSPRGRRTLHERTEGWITGLQLAALSLSRTTDRDRFIASFAGDHRHVADYLVGEVLSRQPPEVQEFLLATSVLRSLTGELCDAVTEGTGSGALLEELADGNLFVCRLDDQRRWYRYHGLFAELLRHRLAARDPAAAIALHRRAAAWYDKSELVAEAIHHALAAGDLELASSLVRRHGSALLAHGEDRAVLEWLAVLPEDVYRQHPELGAFDALARLAVRDVDAAARRVAAVDAVLRATPSPPPDLRAFVRALEAGISLFRGDTAGALRLALEAETVAGELPSSLAGLPQLVLALAHHSRGELSESRARALSGLASVSVQQNPRAVFHLTALVSRIELCEGQLRSAEATAREMLDRAVKNGLWEVSFRAAAQLALAETLYERDALAEAEEVLESAAELTARLGPDELEDLAKEWLARVRLARGNWRPAADVDPQRALRQEQYLHLFERPSYHRLRVQLATGGAAAVEAELRRRGIDPRSAGTDAERERDDLLLARALIARGRSAEAVPMLARLVMAAEEGGRRGTALEALCLQAVARHLSGSTPQAHEALRRALDLARGEGWIRVFVDLGPPMRHLLAHEAETRGGRDDLERLLAAFGEERPIVSPSTSPLAEPIRERELEVLRCLAAGMSNPEIAESLFLSANTVKTHVRHLYEKLGVQRRSDALRRARELGLIPG